MGLCDLAVPPGAYNIVDINVEIKRLVKAKGHDPDNISVTPNYNTLKSRITLAGNYKVDLRDGNKSGKLRSVLDFNQKLLSKNGDHDSDRPVNITDINSVAIGCKSNRQFVHQRIID